VIRLAIVLTLLLPLLVAPDAGSAPGAPVPQCSPGPASCAGWYTGNVTVSWAFDTAGVTQTVGCNVRTVTADGVTSSSCEVWYGDSSFARTVTVRRDATPPQVTGSSFERGADAGGWYNRPVAVAFTGADVTSGIASCDRPTYSGPDASSATVSGICRDLAGNASAPTGVALKFDATPPATTAAAERPPDGKGWYRRPVTVRFNGSDGASGVASCTPAVRYAGPDRKDVSLAGSCRDAAGNVSAEQTLTLSYDDTAPKLRSVRARVARGVARVGWQKPADAALVRIERVPGVNGAKRTHVYSGTGETFVDRTVRRGVTYRYEVSVLDAAGNASGTVVATGPQPALFQPAASATVRAPFTLAWRPKPGAGYYNVQLHRNGVKVLTAWPRKPSFRVLRSWRFDGRRQVLRPGTYTWYVWPGLGSRERPRYGPLLGSSRFVVKR
jgi:hypothetical protein